MALKKEKEAGGDGESPKLALYHPYGAAVELWKCKDPEVLIEGPQGTGKTLAVLHKINAIAFKYVGCRILITRKTRMSMTESVLADFESKVLQDHPAYPKFRNTQRRLRQDYRYPNGSLIVVRGMDNLDDVRSTNFDVVVAFEATQLTEGDWETLTGRCRAGNMPYQQAIADCNPDRPSHWLNVRASRPYKIDAQFEGLIAAPRPGQTQMTRLLSRHQDNPRWWDHEKKAWTAQAASYLSVLQAMTGARYQRYYLGRWAASEGMVYPGFDPQIHVLDYGTEAFPYREIPSTWRRVRAIDFGFTNPFVCQWWAIDPDGRMYLYREIYRIATHGETITTVGDHARRIIQMSASERIEATIADHDADGRATLHKAGIRSEKAFKAITPGIEAVNARIRVAGDNRPRIYVMRDARIDRDEAIAEAGLPTCTQEEFDCYVYGSPKDGKSAKEEPIDMHNHGMDAMRYAVAHVDEISRKRFRIKGGRVRTSRAVAA